MPSGRPGSNPDIPDEITDKDTEVMSRKPKQPSWWMGVAILLVSLFAFLGKMQLDGDGPSTEDPARSDSVSAGEGIQASRGVLPPPTSQETIRMASFNIQVFGMSKLENSIVMNQLAEIV